MLRWIGMACALLVAPGCGDDGDGVAVDAAGDGPPITADAAPVDANPLQNLQPGDPFVLSPGNESGQDEDPSIVVAADGSLYAAWYSNRNPLQSDGREDKEIFVIRSTDGASFTDPPIQVTRSDEPAFYPSMAQDSAGTFHIAWYRQVLLPLGCTPGLDCTGTDNRIAYKSSADGLAWDLDSEVELAGGPGDYVPSLVHDRDADRLLVYFAAVVRDAAGNTDFSDTTLRIYVVINDGTGWTAPARVVGINPDQSHNTFPLVAQAADGTFHMTWTRYDQAASADVLAVIMETSTETMHATSTDGINWTAPATMSSGAGTSIEAFPFLYFDHAGDGFVTWLSTASGAAAAVEIPIGGIYPGDLVQRPELEGYTARVAPTATPDILFGAWVAGPSPTQKVSARLFSR